RIVAFASLRQVILVGHEKLVANLGQLGPVPLEVVPFGLATVLRELARIGHQATVRMHGGSRFLSDNGNVVVDCAAVPGGTLDPSGLEKLFLAIPGVVDTGLFLGTAERVLVGYPDGRVETLMRGVV
ncbi:MAG: ribose-5-phosphate isomerase A, partial [Gemmatimonadota bacterium]